MDFIFFQRKPGSPAGVGGAPGALRPKGGFRATHLEGTSPRPPKNQLANLYIQ